MLMKRLVCLTSRWTTSALLLLMAGLMGCDDSVNPFVEEDRFYTLYGYLDTASPQQYLRVMPLRTIIGADDVATIDATVTTTARENGVTIVWQDSVVTFSDGSLGHIFRGDFRPIPGWTYDLVVERSDGITARASTTVPLPEHVTLADPFTLLTNVTQRVHWQDIDTPPFRVEVWYRFVNHSPRSPFLNAVVVYGEERLGELKDGGWEVRVQLTADKFRVAELLGVSEDTGLALLGVGMRLTMTDNQWRPPGGVYNPEVLVQPGTFSNVENGFGFFGSINHYATEWTLPEDVVQRLGYSYPGKR